jgi:hypothetical protein
VNIIYNKQIDKGKKISIGIIAIINIFVIVIILHNLGKGIGGTFLAQISSILISILISFMFYKGFRFTQYIIGGYLGIVVWATTFYILDIIGLLTAFDGLLMLILTIAIPIFVIILISTNKNISKFMEYQTSKQNKDKNVITYIIFFAGTSFILYFQRDVASGVLLTIPLIYYVVKLLRKFN